MALWLGNLLGSKRMLINEILENIRVVNSKTESILVTNEDETGLQVVVLVLFKEYHKVRTCDGCRFFDFAQNDKLCKG